MLPRKGLMRCEKQSYALIVESNIFYYQRLFASVGSGPPLCLLTSVEAQTMGAYLQALLLGLLEHEVIPQGLPLQRELRKRTV